ncbi:hypothetical protein SAY87_028511 [Trapa incisa]|uniref:Uncharacterized protein n=1 Tax=Trapa incisa TaxID=236973 RepID=A0AAN7QPC6_9MYRT|nr:hypothetical protein SAY87_028511 [Trapa incisa]
MSEEVPTLYANKPKKAHLKRVHELKQSDKESASSLSAAARSYTMGTPPPQPPPSPPPKESFARRYKFLWPLLLTVNLAVGAYLFMRTKKKDPSAIDEKEGNVLSSPASTAVVPGATVSEKPLPLPDQSLPEYLKPGNPIPQDQQRELLKWILEEKRKIKPNNPEEKKHIDEEKALIKHYIRAKSIPNI